MRSSRFAESSDVTGSIVAPIRAGVYRFGESGRGSCEGWRSGRSGTPVCMTRVMIAVDGSDLDARLAEAAHGLFGQDAEYWAVNVHNSLDQPPSGVVHAVPGMIGGPFVAYGAAYPFTLPRGKGAAGGSAGPDDDPASSPRAVAEAAADSAGIEDAEVLTETGDPPAAILNAARRHAADVIVVGSRDRGWWSKLIEPSVSSDVIDESAVPVLVISAPS